MDQLSIHPSALVRLRALQQVIESHQAQAQALVTGLLIGYGIEDPEAWAANVTAGILQRMPDDAPVLDLDEARHEAAG